MKKSILLIALMMLSTVSFAQTKVIAHRGYWKTEGSVQNSLESLRKAGEIGCWGSEFDVWMTADGVCVIHHDGDLNGIRIENIRYTDIRDSKLANGEKLPTLESYLWQGIHVAPTRLILEIKPLANKEKEKKCVDEVLRLVKKYGVANMTDYISFSMNACEYLIEQAPKVLNGPNGQRSGEKVDKVNLRVEYLNGDVAPQDIKAKGLTGIDYNSDVLMNKHPEWIEQCHDLGLEVNVWTVDNLEDVWTFINKKVDKITTNRPLETIKLSK